MKILAIEKASPGFCAKDFQPFLKAEAQRVWELQKAGIIREIYFTQETHEAIIILECDSKETTDKLLNSLPLVQEKLISFEIIVLEPYSGFDRLIKDSCE